MSNKAINWAVDSGIPPGPRFVLVLLADHAGAHGGEDWTCFPSVKLLMDESGFSQSAVERHLKWLIAERWISRKRAEDRKVDDGMFIYTLHRARRCDGKSPRGGYAQRVGDPPTGGAPEGVGDLPTDQRADESANQRRGVGDLTATSRQFADPPKPPSKDEPSVNPLEPEGARAQERPAGERSEPPAGATKASFDLVLGKWGEVAPDRIAPPVDWKAWRKAAELVEPQRLAHAALRYLAESADVKRGRCKALAVWLAEERWTAWLGEPAVAAPVLEPLATFDGPADLMAAIAAIRDAAWIASWLAPCRWNDDVRTIIARTGFAADTLARELGPILDQFNVKVGVDAARERAA